MIPTDSMIPTDPQAQAALIMATGKMVRDRTLRLQSTSARGHQQQTGFGDLSMAQTLAMMAVKDFGPLSITALAAILAVSAPSASTMVERLVERGILHGAIACEGRYFTLMLPAGAYRGILRSEG